jgi:hypothetical protein
MCCAIEDNVAMPAAPATMTGTVGRGVVVQETMTGTVGRGVVVQDWHWR